MTRDLQCETVRLEYDWPARTGRLYMADGDCCDMMACVDLFRRIHEGVEKIQTFSGEETDTRYEKRRGEWVARCP